MTMKPVLPAIFVGSSQHRPYAILNIHQESHVAPCPEQAPYVLKKKNFFGYESAAGD